MTTHFQPLKSVLNLRAGVPSRDLKAQDVIPFIKSLDALADDAAAQALVLSPACIVDGRVQCSQTAPILLTPQLISRHKLEPGEVIVSARGEFVSGIYDKEATMHAQGVHALAGPLCHVLTTQEWSPVIPEFIVWLLGTDYAKQHMAAAARGSATSLYSLETIGGLQVPILPAEKQKTIADAANAARVLSEARIALAAAESEANNNELCRLAGILS